MTGRSVSFSWNSSTQSFFVCVSGCERRTKTWRRLSSPKLSCVMFHFSAQLKNSFSFISTAHISFWMNLTLEEFIPIKQDTPLNFNLDHVLIRSGSSHCCRGYLPKVDWKQTFTSSHLFWIQDVSTRVFVCHRSDASSVGHIRPRSIKWSKPNYHFWTVSRTDRYI